MTLGRSHGSRPIDHAKRRAVCDRRRAPWASAMMLSQAFIRQLSPHLTTRPLSCTHLSGIVPSCAQLVRSRPQVRFCPNSHQLLQPPPHQQVHLHAAIHPLAMTKSTPNLYRDTLQKLAAEPPTTKTALVCSLLVEIEAALRSGKTRKQIWQRLAGDGLDITCETFCRLIRRARKKTRISAARGGKRRSPGTARPTNCDRRGTQVHGRRESQEQSKR